MQFSFNGLLQNKKAYLMWSGVRAGDHVHHVVAARLVAAVVLVVVAGIEVDGAEAFEGSILKWF